MVQQNPEPSEVREDPLTVGVDTMLDQVSGEVYCMIIYVLNWFIFKFLNKNKNYF